MQFRKRPVVIEARQFTDGNESEIVSWLWEHQKATARWVAATTDDAGAVVQPKRIEIPTLEGVMTASVGDWIIRGVAGEFYPCKPDIFRDTYEPVTPRT